MAAQQASPRSLWDKIRKKRRTAWKDGHDIGEVDGHDYLAMAYIAGATLDETIALGPIDMLEAFQIIRDAASAREECHLQGIIHRDFKPSNIFVNQRGTPVVMDFGLASMEDATRLTAANPVIGTMSYMPPEQLNGRVDELGPRSDIYSLGVTLYEALTARRPFPGKNMMKVYNRIQSQLPPLPSSIVASLDSRVDEICLKAIAKVQQDRYQSMAEFAGALDGFLSRAKSE
jgi:serine/threonine-protein kinase